MNKTGIIVAVLLLVLGAGGVYLFNKMNAKPDYVSAWNLSNEKISRDLEGRTAPLPYNQIWPFDGTQNLTVNVVGKKQVEEFVVVVVELKATAKVDQPKDAPKDAKDAKDAPKSPTSISLSGLARLTYERVNGDWYLIAVESISLKALPLD
jgi:hypothetical protein